MNFDISETVQANSLQVNADDLAAPMTVTITSVEKGTAEQPVFIHLAEFPGRTFRPAKTVRRLLVAAWGAEASEYIGRRITIFNDRTVKWAGQEIGGVRISHMSHIEAPLHIHLSVSRGKRAPFTVEPLPDAPKAATGERVANAVKAIHATTTTDELAAIQRRIGADIANDPAIVQALETQTKRMATDNTSGSDT